MAEKSQLLFLPYIQLMRDKEEVIRKLEFLLTSNQREFSLPINQAALLFLIDCDNLKVDHIRRILKETLIFWYTNIVRILSKMSL